MPRQRPVNRDARYDEDPRRPLRSRSGASATLLRRRLKQVHVVRVEARSTREEDQVEGAMDRAPHQCPYCELRFAIHDDVQDHILRDHPEDGQGRQTAHIVELPPVCTPSRGASRPPLPSRLGR